MIRRLILASVVTVVFCCGAPRGRAADEPVAPAPPADSKWTSLFDGKSLTGWKISEFGTQGEVDVQDGEIVLGLTEGCTGVTYTKDFPKIDYEVSLEAMRVEGSDFFCGMTFPVNDSPCTLIVGGWGGALVGLSCIDGNDAGHSKASRVEKFDNKKWYNIRLRVTDERITAWIDDKQVVDQTLAGHKLSIRVEVNQSKPFGIASWCTTAALKNIRVRELKAKPPGG